jgi:hypothetical protein
MTFLVKEDELPDPAQVGLFGADAVVTAAEGKTELVEQFGLAHGTPRVKRVRAQERTSMIQRGDGCGKGGRLSREPAARAEGGFATVTAGLELAGLEITGPVRQSRRAE